MLQIPNDIIKANCSGNPVLFKWNEDLESKFAFDEELNLRLADALNKANYRTNMTLLVCVFEWFVRRFDGVLDLTDAHLRLEAAWASTINGHYLNVTAFEEFEYGDDLPPPSDSVLTVGIARVWSPLEVALAASTGLSAECVNLALLTHHVMSDSTAFDQWFESAIQKGGAIFPREVESYDWEADFYDFTQEKIVPREFFFDPTFEYNDDAAKAVLQQFLDSLDPKTNPYLHTAEEMKANGYTRTPYKIIDLKKG